MSTTKTNIQNEDKLKNDLNRFIEFVNDMKEKAEDSSRLYELGYKDDFAKRLEKIRQEPLETLFSFIDQSERQIGEFLKSQVSSYLKAKREVIQKAYISSNSSTAIQFSIILKEDNEEVRNNFYEFLEEYDDISFSDRFKIIFHFVSKDLDDNINKVEEIELQNG